MTIKETKKEADIYYYQERLSSILKSALEETRKEPGLSILDVSNIIRKVFKPEEVKSLVKNLK